MFSKAGLMKIGLFGEGFRYAVGIPQARFYFKWLKRDTDWNTKSHFFFSNCFLVFSAVNSVKDGNILDCSNLKASVDNKLEIDHLIGYVSERVEDIVGKGEKCWLSSLLFQGHKGLGLYGKELTHY